MKSEFFSVSERNCVLSEISKDVIPSTQLYVQKKSLNIACRLRNKSSSFEKFTKNGGIFIIFFEFYCGTETKSSGLHMRSNMSFLFKIIWKCASMC